MSEAKDYVAKKEIPQLFECLMTGLMYHRPDEHIEYLQNCLEKIKIQGIKNVRWDLFLEAKRAKTPLPRIRSSSLISSNLSRESSFKDNEKKPVLPPISKEHGIVNAISIPNNVEIFFIMGAPGCGKGVIAKMLLDRYDGLVYISMSELLLNSVANHASGSEKWKTVGKAIQKGEMAPDDLVVEVIGNQLRKAATNANVILIDGYPRSVAQVEQWNLLVGRVNGVFLLDCDEEYCQSRLLERGRISGRPDENSESVSKRLAFFKHNTLPVCKHYDDMGLLQAITIESGKNQHEVFANVAAVFDNVIQPKSNAPAPHAIPRPPSGPRPASSRYSRPFTTSVVNIKPLKNVQTDSGRQDDMPHCQIVLLLGGPGSGRTEQSLRVCDRYIGFKHIALGEEVINEALDPSAPVDSWTTLLKLANQGELGADKLSFDQLKQRIQNEGKEAACLLLEGVPINEEHFNLFLTQVGRIDLAILLDCEENYMTTRLLERGNASGGLHDNLAAISKRISFFKEQTLPVVRYLDENGKLNIISGDRESDEVYADISAILDRTFFSKREDDTVVHLDFENVADLGEVDEEIIVPQKGYMTGENENTLPTSHVKEKLAKCKIIFVLGGPGSGKGTQCEKIVQKFNYHHLSSGDLLRSEVESESERGKELKRIMEAGELVSLDIVLALLRDAMLERVDSNSGFLIDGYPRELEQAKRFEEEIASCEKVIYFDVSEEIMKERLLKRGEDSGRVDDNEATIIKRFKTFTEATKPVIDYYEEQNKVIQVDASGDVDEIFNVVSKSLDNSEKDDVIESSVFEEKKTLLSSDTKEKLGNCKIIFVLGGPGSGKGTQCEKIVQKFNYHHLSSGDLLRAEVESESERGKELKRIMEAGELVSLDIVLALLRDAMLERVDSNPGFLIDGYPRELEQAKRFEEEIAPCQQVIFFDVSEDIMKERLLKRGEESGRVDDNEATIVKRFKTFSEATKPVIDYYKEQQKVTQIDSSGDVDDIFQLVCYALDQSHVTENDTRETEILLEETDNAPEEIENASEEQENSLEVTEEVTEETKDATVAEVNEVVAEETEVVKENENEAEEMTESAEEAVEAGDKLKNAQIIFVLGGPGSGKGTQCAKIKEKYGFNHLSSGDLLRVEVESGSERGRELQAIMEAGELVPLDDVLLLLRNAMLKLVETNSGFLIDGFPREIEQVFRFEEEIVPCRHVIYFNVTEEIMKERLLKRGESSGRVDDNEESILKRFVTFNEATKPVIEHFREKQKVTEIDASNDVDAIFDEVCQRLDNLE